MLSCKPLFNVDAALTGSEAADSAILPDSCPESVHTGSVGSPEAHVSNQDVGHMAHCVANYTDCEPCVLE